MIAASRIGWSMSGAAAAVATVISMVLIYKHLQYYYKVGWRRSGQPSRTTPGSPPAQPNQQRYIIRICLMVPIYAIISWLSYFYYRQSIYYEVLRDCYEAFVL